MQILSLMAELIGKTFRIDFELGILRLCLSELRGVISAVARATEVRGHLLKVGGGGTKIN